MDKIPITFEYEGKEYKGTLDQVAGAAGKTWHLMIDNFYWGKLRLNDNGWFFDATPKNESMTSMAYYFGEYITLWYG